MSWIRTADRAIFGALCAVFGVKQDSAAAAKRFRAAYLDEATSPPTSRKENVCYYAISEQTMGALDSLQTGYTESPDGLTATLKKVIPVQVLFTFYGPDADEDAERLWSLLYLDTGQGCARSILRMARMTPLPRPNRPVAAPELDGSLWRRRCDLTVYFNLVDELTVPIAQVESPPEIFVEIERLLPESSQKG